MLNMHQQQQKIKPQSLLPVLPGQSASCSSVAPQVTLGRVTHREGLLGKHPLDFPMGTENEGRGELVGLILLSLQGWCVEKPLVLAVHCLHKASCAASSTDATRRAHSSSLGLESQAPPATPRKLTLGRTELPAPGIHSSDPRTMCRN